MIRFIWQHWWRNKQRFLLLLIGALIVSSGLSYLVGLSETSRGTIVDELQQRWSAPYDILVRPPNSRSVTEELHLLEPNYLSGLSGGISLEQYERIQQMEGIDIAAPIAMIGYMNYSVVFHPVEVVEDGVYRITNKYATNIGPQERVSGLVRYGITNILDIFGSSSERVEAERDTGVTSFDGGLVAGSFVLLAGIDPQAEAEFIGLDDAVLDFPNSRYFRDDERIYTSDGGITPEGVPLETTVFPVLLSNAHFVDKTFTYTVERLDLPFSDVGTAKRTLEMVKENGGRDFLHTVEAVDQDVYSFTSKEAHLAFLQTNTGINPVTGEQADTRYQTAGSLSVPYFPSPLQYHLVTSPYPDRWPFAYEIDVYDVQEADHYPSATETYRPVAMSGRSYEEWPGANPSYIGFYDPGKLHLPLDPLTELPMETYRPATARLVLDAAHEPVNPPAAINPSDDPYDFSTQPPAMLTTIEAAAQILGEEPISAIRVKVDGVDDLEASSQEKLEMVAERIEAETGLITDITLGSSPQPALTYVPAVEDQPELGWLEQPWVRLGSAFTIFQETKLGYSGIIGSVMVVAAVYVFASNVVALLARRKEFAVLLAVGWRPNQLSRLIFLEATLIGSFVAALAVLVLGLALTVHGTDMALNRFILLGLFCMGIYWLGSVAPALMVRRISPHEAMRTGEVAKKASRVWRARDVWSMALNNAYGKRKRSVLSILAMALPTGLLAFFIVVTLHMQGTLYMSWLGEYVALEVGPTHFIAMGVAFLLAILTTSEMMWQNISERLPEIAALKAIGWRNSSVRKMIVCEGFVLGVLAGLLGIGLAGILMLSLYGPPELKHIGMIAASAIVPAIAGMMGAVPPAERAVRIVPAQGLRGEYSNKKQTERRLGWLIVLTACVMLPCLVWIVIYLAPL